MAIPKAPTLITTLAAAATKDDRTISLASVTGLVAVDHRLVVGREIMQVISLNSTFANVRRGIGGSAAVAHINAAAAFGGPPDEFGLDKDGVYRAGYTGVLGEQAKMRLPFGTEYTDPDTGYVYRLCKAATGTIVAGNWVRIDADGTATIVPASTPQVTADIGICIEATSAANDLMWVLVKGSYTGATAAAATNPAVSVQLGFELAAGGIGLHAIANGIKCYNAAALATASGSLVNVIINRPWIDGSDEL